MTNEDQTACLLYGCVWVRVGTAGSVEVTVAGDVSIPFGVPKGMEWGPVHCLRCKKEASEDFVRPERVVKAVCPKCEGPLVAPSPCCASGHVWGPWEAQPLFAFKERECTWCAQVESRMLPEGEEEV